MLIEYHRNMLGDRVRNQAFHRALAAVIEPGKTTVADIGSGTGVLGFLARSLGAKDVYFYEQAGVIKLSQLLARRNRLDHCHFFNEHSTAIIDPPQVDVIVCETLGNYAYEECIIETIEDAKRFLKPGGVIIPQGIEQYVSPVINERYYAELTVWDEVKRDYGLDFSLAKIMSLNNIYVRSFKPDDLLEDGASAQLWDKADFREQNTSHRTGRAQWMVRRDTVIYGFAVWWSCELAPDIALATAPGAPRTHWEQLYFPVRKPLHACSNDRFVVTLASHSSYEAGTDLQWRVELQAQDGRRKNAQIMDLRKGYL